MGLTCGWIAIRGLGKEAALERLQLSETGESREFFNARFACAELPGNWIVITANKADWASQERTAAASAGCEAIGCQASEVVMWSGAWGCRDGVRQWSVTHDPDKNVDGVDVKGEPPPEFAGILRKFEDDQARAGDGVDCIFEVPIALTAAICGFDPYGLEPDAVFPVLAPVGAAREGTGPLGWLGKLFGGTRRRA